MFMPIPSNAVKLTLMALYIAGLVLNMITIIVLRKRNTLGTRLLLYLAYVDEAILLLGIVFMALQDLQGTILKAATTCLETFLFPVYMTAYTLEVYITVLIAAHRCLIIEAPVKLIGFIRVSVVNKVLIGTGLLCVLYNLPVWILNKPKLYWNTEVNHTLIQKANTTHMDYHVMYDTSRTYVDSLIPSVIIVVCDVILVIKGKKSSPIPGQIRYYRGKNQLTSIIISITTMSILLHVIGTWLYGIFSSKIHDTDGKDYGLLYAARIILFLNSSINFFFYCLFAPEFRITMMSVFSRK